MSVADELAEVLAGVSRPGDFSVSCCVELQVPRIEVEGVGTVALPVLPAQAKALIKAASQAPYGRGSETIIDTKVRKTWQIGAEQVSTAPLYMVGIIPQTPLDSVQALVAHLPRHIGQRLTRIVTLAGGTGSRGRRGNLWENRTSITSPTPCSPA